MKLTLDEKGHIYRVDAVVLPSVTQILDYHRLRPPYPVGPYRERGKAIHRATHAIHVIDSEHRVKVGHHLVGYMESYKEVARWPFRWKNFERALWHPTELYAGTLDRDGIYEDTFDCLADIKSGDTGDETEIQTGGYAVLKGAADNIPAHSIRRFKIRLYEDGSPAKVTELKNPLACKAFLGYLATYQWENKQKGY